jgi:hypothetical protein
VNVSGYRRAGVSACHTARKRNDTSKVAFLTTFRSLRIVLDQWTSVPEKRIRFLRNDFVPPVWRQDIRILEDEDDDEHENEFSSSEFGFNDNP